MTYNGKDLHKLSCLEFLENNCIVQIDDCEYSIELSIYLKESGEMIASAIGFYYNYLSPYSAYKENAMHIKSLGVSYGYRLKGIATYMLKELIKIAEKRKFNHITVHPYASRYVISQNKLEEFYQNFTFKSNFFNRNKKIKFNIIMD
jgi:ribosomal protein S18 acetylase RimI-like enzyme